MALIALTGFFVSPVAQIAFPVRRASRYEALEGDIRRYLLGHDLHALDPILDWVDVRFGPIIHVRGLSLAPPDPRWWICICELARSPVGTWVSPSHFGAAGASTDLAAALQAALAEAVERYSSLNPDRLDEESALLRPADSNIATRFPSCADHEDCPDSLKGLSRISTPIRHVPTLDLATGDKVMVPRAYVEIMSSQGTKEPLVTMPISTGCAFHMEPWKAVWRGLCEVAERDAMMLMWWLRKPSPEIIVRPVEVPAPLASRMLRLRAVDLDVRLFDITADFRVPTVFCVLISESFPYITVGASCQADASLACCKAIDEAVAARVASQWDRWSREIPSFGSFDWVSLLEDHMMLYASWKQSPALNFLLERHEEDLSYNKFAAQDWWRAPSNSSGLVHLARRLLAMGLTVLWCDITATEAVDIGRVVRVVVPEMMPLSQDHNARWLGTKRLLQQAPPNWNSEADVNPFPHPFA
jgi:ribosomal protein S12 methylthiotransferase accessory factor